MSRRLPVELYRDIVDHLSEYSDLFSLSTTSRSLCYEAERVLYRELTIDLDCDKPLLNTRIVDHVIKLRIYSIRRNGPSPLSILQSVKNLKSLHLLFMDSISVPFLDHCPRDPPFLLHQLSISHYPGDPGLKAFIQSQRQITRFIWSRASSNTIELSPNDFPALISLSISSPNIVIPLLLSGRIHHLHCGGDFSSVIDQLRDGTVLTTVRALSVLGLDDMDLVAAIFTHLEYLEARIFLCEDILSSIAQFTKLKKLKIRLPSRAPVEPSDPSEFFDGNTALNIVEIWSGKRVDGEPLYSGTIYQRGISTPRECHSQDHDEWWKW